jgi:hypothetical protein
MSWLVRIEKFQGGRRTAQHQVPMALLRLAGRCLPGEAIESLADRGINLPGILLAQRLRIDYSTRVDVIERGTAKTVVVSWQPRG